MSTHRNRAAALLFAALGAADAFAWNVTVTVAGAAEGLPAAVSAIARRVDHAGPAVDLQLPVGTTSVDLAEGTWEIATNAADYWSAPVYASASQPATLRLWPRASIKAKLGHRAPASGELLVHFASPEGGPTGSVVCAFADRDWACSLPAGELDLRISLTGFATEFRWGVKTAAGATLDLGALDFTPGSSVYGRVDGGDATAEVLLRPVNAGTEKVRQYSAKRDAKGFFQIRGLAPGEYAIHAQAEDLISDTRTVRIIANTNASLREPLVLAKPARLLVALDPPLDEQQRPWQVELLVKEHGARRLDILDRSLASEKGTWSRSRLTPGDYLLEVQQQDGSKWKSAELTIRAGDGDVPLQLALEKTRVSGTVKLGERPIAASVRFHEEHGPELIADAQGRFEGTIPPPGDEPLTLLVTSETPDVKRTLVLNGERAEDGGLHFDIELPATTITGRTINEDGSPQGHAIVTLSAKTGRTFEQMFSREDGSFQFFGFEPGSYAIQAEGFRKMSSNVDVEARSDAASSIDLILRAHEQVRGRVFMGRVPVAGAVIHARPRNVRTVLGPMTTSGASGWFLLDLPPGTTTYDTVVIPRGFYVTLGRIDLDPKEGLRVEVGQNGGALTVDAPENLPLLLHHAGAELSLSFIARESGGVVETAGGRQRLTIPSLEPGTYAVCGRKCESVYVPPFATALLTLQE